MDMSDRRESDLQDYNPNIDANNYYGEEEIIREDNIHHEDYQEQYEAPPADPQQQHVHSEPQVLSQDHEAPRQTSISNKLEYENVRVSFPSSTDTGINSYMIYKMKYTWRGMDFVVNRRFSDFRALRNSLRKFLPCHYMYPVHKKRTIVS